MKLRRFLAVVLLVAGMGTAAAADLVTVDATKPFEPQGRPLEGLVITLDAGHGGSAHQAGYSGSARGKNSNAIEGDLNILVTSELRWHLINAGAQVHMTRLDDRRMTLNPEEGEATNRAQELGARTAVAERTHSHIFLSLHHNSAGPTADWVVLLIWPKEKDGTPQPLETALGTALGEEVQKVVHHTRPWSFYENEHPLVANNSIPSAVIEFGFLSNPAFDAWVSRPGAHTEEAIGAYNGIVKFWTEHRAELEARRLKLFPDAKPVVRKGKTPAAEALAESLMPAGLESRTAEDARFLISQYKARVLSDATSFYLSAEAEKTSTGWALKGSASNSRVAKALGATLEAAGFEPLENRIETLPSAKLGEEIFGVVQIPMALTWGAPKEGESVQTQVLLGESLFLLDRSADGDYYLVQGADSYIGWVRREAVLPMAAREFQEWTSRPTARVTRDIMIDDFRLPTAALLPVAATSDTTATVVLPKGVRATKGRRETSVPLASLRLESNPSPGRIAAETAVSFLNTPYVFGGRTRLGMDCSGLVSASWPTAGLLPARDAKQQVIAGRLVATEKFRDGLRPGDLVYFLDEVGRVYHTGISLGGSRFIHCSPPHVQVSSFDPNDPLYAKDWTEQFAFGRRPME